MQKRTSARLTLLALALVIAAPLAARALEPVSASALAAVRSQETLRASQALARLQAQRSSLGLNARHDFTLKNTHSDRFGRSHVRVQQQYQGVPVWGGQAVLHLSETGQELERTDALKRDIGIETTPMLSVSEALAVAHATLAPKGGYAKPPTAALVIYPVIAQTLRPGAEGQINAQDLQPRVARYALAYHVHAELRNRLDPISHMNYLVDASTGAVLKQWNALRTEAAVGTGASQYNGTVQLNTNRIADGQYELRDLTRGSLPNPWTGEVGNSVHDMNHAYYLDPSQAIYTDADNSWGDGGNYIEGPGELGTTSANGQTAAVDAGFGLQATWDYFLKVHGRNGIDGAGTSTTLQMHFADAYDNAFWDDACFCMTFGDGDSWTTVTSIDLIGHEMSHGLNATTAALNYVGESGALDEADSDIHGTMVEFYARGGSGSLIGNTGGNWTFAEQLSPKHMRYLYRPDLDGTSPNYWYPNLGDLDVHYSSGPMNRAFYFLSQGATVSGDTSTQVNLPMLGIGNANFLPSGMAGVGNEVAAAIWYRALTAYMTMTTDYLGARHAAERAAVDLYGADSPALQAVQNAFAGINVGLPAGAVLDTVAPVATARVLGGPSGSLTLNAIATDNIAVTQVVFYVDGRYAGLGTLAAGSHSLAINSDIFLNGTHSLEARAYDGAGNLGRSEAVLFSTGNPLFHPLFNGDFEQRFMGWLNYEAKLSTTTTAGGSYALLLGGGANLIAQCYQEGLAIPAGCTSLTIGFDVRLETANPTAGNQSPMLISLTDSPATALKQYGEVASFNPGDIPANTWVHKSYLLDRTHFKSFDSLAGQGRQVSLLFDVRTGVDPTSWLIDNITFEAAVPISDVVAPVVGAATVTRAGTVYRFEVTATDAVAVARVDFYVDGTKVAQTSQWPYQATLDSTRLGQGSHRLEAWVFDLAGNVAKSAAVPFTQADPVPADTQAEQEGNDTVAMANALLPGMHRFQGSLPTLQDVDHYRITIAPGQTLGLAMTGPEFINSDLTLLSASGTVIAKSATATSTEHLTYTNPGAGPIQVYARVVPFAIPSTLPYFLTPTLYLAPQVTARLGGVGPELVLEADATAAAGALAQVEFYVDEVLCGTVSTPPYALKFNASTLVDGNHRFIAKAHDLAGNSASSAPVSFSTPFAPVAPIQAASTLTRDAVGQVASTVNQPGSSYLWSIEGGVITAGADGAVVTFSAGTGASLTLALAVTSPAGQVATASKVIALVPGNFDLDGDVAVDPLDLAVFVPALGTQRGDLGYNLRADLNGDGQVAEADIKIFLTGLN